MIRSLNPSAVTISIVSLAGAGKVLRACLGGRKYSRCYLGELLFLYLLLACFVALLFKGLCNFKGAHDTSSYSCLFLDLDQGLF